MGLSATEPVEEEKVQKLHPLPPPGQRDKVGSSTILWPKTLAEIIMAKPSTDSVAHLMRPSRSEWVLLAIVGRLGRASLTQIVEEGLRMNRILDHHSSHKMLTRLVDKGYLKTGQDENLVVFFPRIDIEVVFRLEVERFLDEVAGDDRTALELVADMVGERLRSAKGGSR